MFTHSYKDTHRSVSDDVVGFVRKTGTDEYIYERFLGLAERSGTSSGTQHSYKNKSSQATIIRHPTLTLTLTFLSRQLHAM